MRVRGMRSDVLSLQTPLHEFLFNYRKLSWRQDTGNPLPRQRRVVAISRPSRQNGTLLDFFVHQR